MKANHRKSIQYLFYRNWHKKLLLMGNDWRYNPENEVKDYKVEITTSELIVTKTIKSKL